MKPTNNQINYTPIPDLFSNGKKQDDGLNNVSISTTKEGEPINILIEKTAQEFGESILKECVTSDKETSKYVKIQNADIDISQELLKVGITPVNNHSSSPSVVVHLPITDEKVIEGLRKPITSSFRWLAEIALFMLKHAHMTLKVIHGKVIRIASTKQKTIH